VDGVRDFAAITLRACEYCTRSVVATVCVLTKGNFMNTPNTSVEQFTEQAKNTATNLVGKVERSADQISDDADDLLRTGARHLKEGTQAAKNAYDRFGRATCEFIAEKPVTAMAIGALTGFVLAGIALGRRR
jgi:ElaB/YqjD/DUF883 family membrane-anchored ribosome-binding protein